MIKSRKILNKKKITKSVSLNILNNHENDENIKKYLNMDNFKKHLNGITIKKHLNVENARKYLSASNIKKNMNVKGVKNLLSVKKNRWILAGVVCIFAILMVVGNMGKEEQEVQYLAVKTVSPKEQNFSLYGNYIATVEPENKVSVMPMITGEVKNVLVKLGDTVEEGDIICTVDEEDVIQQSETADLAVERAHTSYNSAIDSMSIKAPISGYVRSIDAELGVTVSPTTEVAHVTNNDEMTVEIPFLDSLVDNSWVGESALLKLSDTGESLNGIVTDISGAPQFIFGNVPVNYVTISVQNPGALQGGRSVSAVVNGMASTTSGNFESAGDGPVTAGITGIIEGIYVQNGDWVDAGDTMFKVGNSNLQNQLNNAKNSIIDTEQRQEDVYELLSDHLVKSPISGTISNIEIQPFDNLGTSSIVAEVSTEDNATVTFEVTEKVIKTLELGQKLEVVSEKENFNGKITEIATVANPQTGLFTVKGNLKTEEAELLAGTTIEVRIANYTEKNTLVIPFKAVQFQGENAYVYKYEDGISKKTQIVTGEFDEDNIIVIEGLEEEDIIISTWSAQLRDGAPVEMEGMEDATD